MRSRCIGCGHVTVFPAVADPGPAREGFDPLFGLPLFLVEPIGSKLLWAYNGTHVSLLEAWLGAALRERATGPGFMTMMARLPRWMKAAAARPRVVKGLALLRARIEREGLS